MVTWFLAVSGVSAHHHQKYDRPLIRKVQRPFRFQEAARCCTKVQHMARNFLTRSRHGTIYYFRLRVPDDLLTTVQQPFLIRSLGTSERSQAIILARAYAAQTDIAFTQLRTMSDKKLTAQELLDNFAKLPDCRERIRRAGMQVRLEESERERERLEREIVEGLYQQQEQQKRHARDLEVALA